MSIIGSYQNGFAPRDGQPLYPELWRGCVGAWAPCLGPTGLTLRDWSGYANHGTLNNMDPGSDWLVSAGGYALDFDGTNDFVQIDGTRVYAADAQPFSISVWAFVRSLTGNVYTKLVMLRADSSSAFEFGVSSDVSYLGLLSGSATSWGRCKSDTSTALTTGSWRHFGITYNGATRSLVTSFQFYLDGAAINTTGANAFSPTTNSTTLAYNVANNRLNGQLREVIVYNRALSANEWRLLASRCGIAYDLAPRKRTRTFAGFKAYWAARKAQILGGGV